MSDCVDTPWEALPFLRIRWRKRGKKGEAGQGEGVGTRMLYKMRKEIKNITFKIFLEKSKLK